jgi:mannosyltransferase
MVLILMLGFLLRILLLQTRGTWYDDAFSIFLSGRTFPEILLVTAAIATPPLYYILLNGWMKLGSELWILRSLNVILSLICIFLTNIRIGRLAHPVSGLWSAFLVAISPIHIYHAQELRMYMLLTVSLLGYAIFFSQIWTMRPGVNRPWKVWVGFVGCGVIAMCTHNLAVFPIFVPLIVSILLRKWRIVNGVLISQALIELFSLPWLVILPGQIDKMQSAFWMPRPGLVEILQAVIQFPVTLPLPNIWQSIVIILSVETLVFVGWSVRRVLGSIGIFHSSDLLSLKQDNIILLVAFALLPAVMMFCVSYIMRPIFVPRGFLMSSVAYMGLAGIGIASIRSRAIGLIILSGFVSAAIISLPYQYRYDHFPRSPFSQATAYLQLTAVGDAKIIHDNKLSYFPCAYYAPDLAQSFLTDEPGSHNDTLAKASQEAMQIFPEPDAATAAENSEEVFFVVFNRAIEEYQLLENRIHPNLDWLETHFKFKERIVFQDLEIYHYGLATE